MKGNTATQIGPEMKAACGGSAASLYKCWTAEFKPSSSSVVNDERAEQAFIKTRNSCLDVLIFMLEPVKNYSGFVFCGTSIYLQQPAESANPTQCTMMQFAAINCTIRSDDWRQQHYKNVEYSIGNEIAYLDLHDPQSITALSSFKLSILKVWHVDGMPSKQCHKCRLALNYDWLLSHLKVVYE